MGKSKHSPKPESPQRPPTVDDLQTAAESILATHPAWSFRIEPGGVIRPPGARFETGSEHNYLAVRILPETRLCIRSFGVVIDAYDVVLISNGKADLSRTGREPTLDEALTRASRIMRDRGP